MGKIICGPIVAGNELIQIFRSDRDFLSSISIKLATYGNRLSSSLSFSLFRMTGQSASPGNLRHVTTVVERGQNIVNNEFFDLYFQPEYKSAGHLYMLKVFSDDAGENNSATAWLDESTERLDGHLNCFVSGQSQGDHGVTGALGYSPPTPFGPVPEYLIYSPVTQCNLNCIHCISRETREHRDRLPQQIRLQIKDWCRRGLIKKIYTDYSGDILWADERWPGELDFLIDLNVPYHVDTNGTHLTEARSLKLLSSRLAWLNLSLDAARPETYARIRKGSLPLETVLANAKTFATLRKQAEATECAEVSLGFTLMRSNIDELGEFVQIAAKTGISVVAGRHLEAYTAALGADSLWHEQERFNDAREAALELAASLGITLILPGPFTGETTTPGHRPCLAPWSSAVLLGNGDVQVCCLPRTKIGNLNEQSMEEIWAGPEYADFRLSLNTNNGPSICNACGYSRKPGNRLSYLPHEATWVSPYESNKAKRRLGSNTR